MIECGEGRLPNFLIAGAAKSGTTALYHYLKQHPDVFMSGIKEPCFISSHFYDFSHPSNRPGRVIVRDPEEYCRLFAGAAGERAVGEASVDNLYYHEKSIGLIKNYLGDPKIIIILRNPVDRAYSAYTHLLRDGRETLAFEEALDAEEERIREGWRFIWHYRAAGLYYEQVKAFKDNFTEVKVFLFEDLISDSRAVVEEAFAFLGVDGSFSPDTGSRYNVSSVPRVKLLTDFFAKPTLFRNAIRSVGKSIIGEDNWIKLRERARSKLLVRAEMEPATRRRLEEAFREDVLRLQSLIGRDLRHWAPGGGKGVCP